MSSTLLHKHATNPLTSARSIVLCVLMLLLAPVWMRSAAAAERRYESEWDSSDSFETATTAQRGTRATALLSSRA